LVVQLIDIRHPPTKDDLQMIDYMVEYGIPFVIVLTKKDKLNTSEIAQRIQDFDNQFSDFEGIKILPVSSETGEGIGELRGIIDSVTQD